MSKEQLEGIKEKIKLFKGTKSVAEFESIAAELLLEHGDYLIEQAERVQELERQKEFFRSNLVEIKASENILEKQLKKERKAHKKTRQQFKRHKHSTSENWRAQRATQNRNTQLENVLEKFREENKRHLMTMNAMQQIFKDAINSLDHGEKVQGLEYGVEMARKALEDESDETN